MKQPVHKCGSLCKVESDTPAPGGPSLGSVMKQKGDQSGPSPQSKSLPNRMPSPRSGGGGKTEQPQ